VPKAARSEDKYRGEAFASGLELVVPTVVFTLLGLWADSALGHRPLFLIVGFCFGAAAPSPASTTATARAARSTTRASLVASTSTSSPEHDRPHPSGMSPSADVPDLSVPEPRRHRVAHRRRTSPLHALWVRRWRSSLLGIWQGVGGALGAWRSRPVVVLANFLDHRRVLGWAARISPAMIMAVSRWAVPRAGSSVIFGMGLLVEQIDAVNLDVVRRVRARAASRLLGAGDALDQFQSRVPRLKPRKS
jgi:F0F1-type ATP synthase assembly protein I